MAVPYTFASATTSIPLSQLDSNFATTITLGNTAIQLGNTVTTLNNMTLANVTVSSGNVTVTNATATTATATTLTSPASTNLTIQSAGTTAMTIDTSQNVGIGTSSPSQKLQVNGGNLLIGTAGSNAVLYLDSTSTYVRRNSSDGSLVFNNQAASNTIFTTSASETMRIDSSGRLLVGLTASETWQTSAPVGQFKSGNVALSAYCTDTGTNDALAVRRDATLGTLVRFYNSTTSVGTITYNGTNTLYNATSDERLKENIVDSGSALEKIDSIKIRSFDWIKSGVHTDFGVIAQELQKVAPECVTEGEDNEDGTMKNPWSVDTSPLVPMLIKSIQEQQSIITALTARIVALEEK